MEDRLLTDKQIAELAQVSEHTVRYWRSTGQLRSVKVGRHPRIWLSEFLHFIGEKSVKMPAIEDGQMEKSNVAS